MMTLTRYVLLMGPPRSSTCRCEPATQCAGLIPEPFADGMSRSHTSGEIEQALAPVNRDAMKRQEVGARFGETNLDQACRLVAGHPGKTPHRPALVSEGI